MVLRRTLKWLAWVVVVLLCSAAVFRVVLNAVPAIAPMPSWTSADGTPTPPGFLYAMFPVDNAVPLCNAPNGAPVATLARAVTNSQEEINSGGWIQVREPQAVLWVDSTQLRFLPAPDASTDYFASFATVYAARDPGKLRAASLDLRPGAAGATIARLRLRPDDDHWEDYVYEISAGRATPLEMSLVFGPAEMVKDSRRYIAAAGAAIGLLALAVAGSVAAGPRKNATKP